jgi:LemA protein
MIALIIILVVVIVLAVIAIGLYNNLVKLRNAVDNAWSQIDVQLQRRLDLIPNLVETVKGYASHESGTFQAVTQARAACMSAQTPEAKMDADNMLTGTLKSLFAVAEAYPELKANTNFLDLQAQLKDTEDKISYMRQSFNDVVMRYNTAIQTFPGVIFAGPMGFTKKKSFAAVASAATAPTVDFGSNASQQ